MKELILEHHGIYQAVVIITMILLVVSIAGVTLLSLTKIFKHEDKGIGYFLLRDVLSTFVIVFITIIGAKRSLEYIKEESVVLKSGNITNEYSYVIQESNLLTLYKSVTQEVKEDKELLIDDGVFVIKGATGLKVAQERVVDVRCKVKLSECLEKIKSNLALIVTQTEPLEAKVVQF